MYSSFGHSARGACKKIRYAFQSAQILKHFEIDLPTVIKVDLCDLSNLIPVHGILFLIVFKMILQYVIHVMLTRLKRIQWTHVA